MSVAYPVPTPIAAKLAARPVTPYAVWTMYLPAAPVADVQLPSLVMAPMMPPQGPRL
jgi:hypothetical protein